ncbi:hypothetical protein SAMN04490357_1063 [Streptomyces misionensis]|uniref:Uncharacterized protein n=1 Tax=Streptomyces misionensis TaxID=67331 RepID=A0A1H4PDZ3_9ACTN|nr:hypothetical protein [Streptomyces misionensis]SEC05414.1 hypothetical protein SAMN04490357_1063 [Streptomyces misionensis]
MRPERFQNWLLDTVKNTPDVGRVQTLAEAGIKKYPFGIAITRGGREERWQIMHQLAEGEKLDHAESPVEGVPFTSPAPHPGDAADVWLAGVIGAAECPEISRVDRWAARPEGSRQAGLTVFFHCGSRNFVRPL